MAERGGFNPCEFQTDHIVCGFITTHLNSAIYKRQQAANCMLLSADVGFFGGTNLAHPLTLNPHNLH